MPGVITTGNIAPLLRDGLQSVFGEEYDREPTQYTMLFDTEQSNKAFEIQQQLEGFGLAPVKPEGGGVEYDSQQSGYSPKYVNLTYAKGFTATEEAIEDNLYNVFRGKARKLASSMKITKETVAANIYNRAFNAAFVMQDGDGVSLLNSAHVRGPSDSSTYSNVLATPAALSEASVEAMVIQIKKATDARGLKIAIRPQSLIVPNDLEFEATRILESTNQSGTANNDTNALRNLGSIRDGLVVNDYLTSATSWFIKTNAPTGLTHQNRRALKFDQDGEFDTSNLKMKASERYSFGWGDARGLYGSQGV